MNRREASETLGESNKIQIVPDVADGDILIIHTRPSDKFMAFLS